MALTADQFAKAVINAGLSSSDEIKSIWTALPAGSRPKNGETFAKVLVEREKLTHFQASELLAGSTTPLVLGDYVLLAKIGAGGMGQVFKAQHRHMKRLVAIKLLPTEMTKDPEAVKRFQREVEAAAKLSHPNIVQAHDASVLRGVWYLVMEYVEGRDLSGVVADNGPLPVELAVEYIRQAAKGLAFAHENGVVHRDIKPANLLLDKKGTIKILDMGLARFEDGAVASKDGLTQTGQVMGTIDYMAPEQAFDTHAADARADIYSLGCTLYRLLTGANLFEADTLVNKLMAHQQQPAPELSQRRADSPRELDAIFRKMVAKKPENRYQSMAEVEAALTALLSGGPASSPAPTPEPASKLTTLFRSFTSQGTQPQPAVTGAAALVRLDVATSPTSGDAATMALASHSQVTDPVSQRSVQIARGQAPEPAGVKKPPLWRQPRVLIAGGLGGALLVLLGIWVIIRDKDGNEIGRVKVPDGGKVEIVEDTSTAKTKVTNTGWPADAPPPAIAPFDATRAKEHQKEWAEYLKVPVEYANTIGMKFVLIPPGEFTMGSTAAEINEALKFTGDNTHHHACVRSEGPQHKVRLTQPFYLGVHEVTQNEYQTVMQTNPSHYSSTGSGKTEALNIDTRNYPVEMVSWNDAAEFCSKLSERQQLKPFYIGSGETITRQTGNGYRLPTEAEWEFACRAGTTTRFWSGDTSEDLVPFGWFTDNSRQRMHAIEELKANAWGLFDLHGNVSEWVQDGWEPNYFEQFANQPAVDPIGPASTTQRLLRGGDCTNPAARCRSASRLAAVTTLRTGSRVGFRAVLTVEALKKDKSSATPPVPSDISALEFDGVDDHVEFPTLRLNGLNEFTIEARVRPVARPGKKGTIVAGLSDPLFALEVNEEGRLSGYLMRGRQPTGVFGPGILDGAWHDVAVTVSGSKVDLFLDGKPQRVDTPPYDAVPNNVNVPRNRFLIGAGQAWDVQALIYPFQGEIDDLRVSRTVRHRGEYAPSSRLAADKETLALYHFDEGNGSELKDFSGNNHHGQIVGAKWVKVDGGGASSVVTPERAGVTKIAPHERFPLLKGHEGPIRRIRFLPDGKQVVSVARDGTARLWNVETGETVRQFDSTGSDKTLNDLAVSPDGKRLAMGGSIYRVYLFDIATGQQERIIALQEKEQPAVGGLAFSADGQSLFVGNAPGVLHEFRVEDGSILTSPKICEQRIMVIQPLPDNERLLVAAWSELSFVLWNRTKQLVEQRFAWTEKYQSPRSVTLFADGERIASAHDNNVVRIWSLKTGEELKRWKPHVGSAIASTEVLPLHNDRWLLTLGDDKAIRLWDGKTFEKLDEATTEQLATGVGGVSPDGRMLVTGAGSRLTTQSEYDNHHDLHVWRLPLPSTSN